MAELSIADDESDMDVCEYRVREIVRDRCAPELEEHYVHLSNVLAGINYTIHMDELDLIFSLICSQAIDPLEIVPSVDEVMRTAIDKAMAILGITFDMGISIEMLVEASEILLLFDPTDNPTLITNTLAETEDDIDALIKLLVLLGTYEYEQWMEVVSDVSDSFTGNLLKIVRRAEESQVGDEIVESVENGVLDRVARLMKGHRDTFAADLVMNNVGIGVSLESLYQVHVGRFIDMPPEKAVSELYALASMSSESFESSQRIIGYCLDDLFIDIQDRGRAERLRPDAVQVFKPIFGVE